MWGLLQFQRAVQKANILTELAASMILTESKDHVSKFKTQMNYALLEAFEWDFSNYIKFQHPNDKKQYTKVTKEQQKKK